MVKTTGQLPTKAELDDGTKFELSLEKINNRYLATMWQMVDGVQEHIFSFAYGKTVARAKENLKKKILFPA